MTTHGEGKKGEQSLTYQSWRGMRQRCTSPNASNWDRYGGRGITFCAAWNKFENFLEDMGPRPSKAHRLDRRDNDGPYDKANCRWVTHKQNMRNTSGNRPLVLGTVVHRMIEWAEIREIKYDTLRQRLNRLGWSTERALSTP